MPTAPQPILHNHSWMPSMPGKQCTDSLGSWWCACSAWGLLAYTTLNLG